MTSRWKWKKFPEHKIKNLWIIIKKKTWLTALFCVVRCILFPRTKICIASSTRIQANEVLSKIEEDFLKNYSWGSNNLRREISYYTIGANKAVVNFTNGSWIKVVTASDSGRGFRCNILIADEFRMIEEDTINTVLRRFLTAPRQPGYLSNPEYEHLQERNKEIYMSSAWMKSHWSYDKCRSFFVNMLDDTKKYFVCGLPYQLSIKENLLSREQIEDEMSEADFDDIKFQTEMQALFWGDDEDAFFSYDAVNNRRRLKNAVYPPQIVSGKKGLKIPDLVLNERRILSVDIALMASSKGKRKNDATSIIINSAIPTNSNKYVANIIYLENHEGLVTNDLVIIIRRLYEQFKCTDLVLDAESAGTPVFDLLVQDTVDPETGQLYPALNCCNNKEMAERCEVENAPKEIWAIKASASFNTEICTLLRSGFQNGYINLLVSDLNCDDILKERISGYKSMDLNQKVKYRMPYIQTTLLVNELVNLQHKIQGTNIKIIERSGARKDRYSSLAYNYWVQCQLEREILRKPKNNLDFNDYVKQLGKLTHRPKMY